jgi:energy-converting hydrogenase Eha subunit B
MPRVNTSSGNCGKWICSHKADAGCVLAVARASAKGRIEAGMAAGKVVIEGSE